LGTGSNWGLNVNFETRVQPMNLGDSYGGEAYDAAQRRRRIFIGGLILLLLVMVGAWWAFSSNKAADTAAGGPGGAAAAAPNVTVVIPGPQQVSQIVSATGTIAARREMPVGVAGEGGQVLRVLVEPGQWVGAGQVLATVDRQVQVQQLNALAAQVRVAQADANLAQSELDRARSLVERGFISKADLDRKTATRDSAAARVRVAEAQVGEARARTGRLDVRAPAAGLVLTRQIEPGQVVSSGSGVLFRMARGGEMEMMAQLAEADLQKIAVGTGATVTPVGTNLNISGQIWQIAPVIDPQSRQGMVRIALPYSSALRPGGFADARLVAGQGQSPLLPESAVLSNPEGNYVYVVGPDNVVKRQKVVIGSVNDAGVAIASGLTGNERVVVVAGAFLNPGDKVKPVLQKSAAR
jgi:HlyD family secretion protein